MEKTIKKRKPGIYTELLSVRVSVYLLKQVRHEAKRRHLSVGDYVRRTMENGNGDMRNMRESPSRDVTATEGLWINTDG